jgi:hypothetical protein
MKEMQEEIQEVRKQGRREREELERGGREWVK